MKIANPAAAIGAVLDANLYVSAFTKRTGVPYSVWDCAARGDFALFISPTIVKEIARDLRRKFHWPDDEVLRVLKLITRVATIVRPSVKVLAVARDPDDDRILECADAARADVIVSGDRDLLALKSYEGIAIVRPIDFLRALGK